MSIYDAVEKIASTIPKTSVDAFLRNMEELHDADKDEYTAILMSLFVSLVSAGVVLESIDSSKMAGTFDFSNIFKSPTLQ